MKESVHKRFRFLLMFPEKCFRFPMLLSVIIVMLLYWIFGSYYGEYTDNTLAAISAGHLTSKPLTLFNNYGNIFGLTHLICWINEHINYNAYGILSVTLNIFILYNMLIIFKILFNKQHFYQLILTFLFAAFLFEYLLFFVSSSCGIILFTLSFLNLILHWKYLSKKEIFIIYVGIIMGILFRPLLILIPGLIFLPFFFQQVLEKKQAALSVIPIIFITFCTIWLSSKSYNHQDRYYNQFAQYKSAIWDKGTDMSHLMLGTAKDSVIIESFENHFFPDKSVFNPTFFEKIGVHPTHTFYEFIREAINDPMFKFKILYKNYLEMLRSYHLFFFFFILVALVLAIDFPKKVVFFLLYSIFLMLILSFLVKTEAKIFVPIFKLMLFTLVLALPVERKKIRSAFLLLVLIYSSYTCFKILQLNRYYVENSNKAADFINTIPPDKLILTDIWIFKHLENELLGEKKHIENLYCFDNGYFSLMDAYWKQNKFLNSNQLMAHLYSSKSQVLVLACDDRIAIWEKYFNTIYGEHYVFRKLDTSPKYLIIQGYYQFGIYAYALEKDFN